ncbi:hypothetical protein OHA70_34730 [Kribbella sp. NBC_00382]|uniref:DUF6923 family protein n=1 Tax=Kribbella sp. NBC_00382 TaxID=2975967 RepID=UPI002E248FB8
MARPSIARPLVAPLAGVRPVLRASAGVGAFVLACLTTVLVAGSSDAAADCSMLQFQTAGYSSLSRLALVELPSGRSTDLGRLDYQINAAGYAKDQDLVYGIATRDRSGWLRRRPHLVTVDRRGAVTDLGQVRVGVGGVADPTAGAVAGSRLYLRDGHRLYTMDIDPGSTTYKSVVKVVHLSSVLLALSVDDFAVNPVDGLLYGISTSGQKARVVSLDPQRGKVKVVATVRGIPGRDSYSSVVMSGGVLYAVRTGYGSRSHLYRVGLDGSSTSLATLPAAVGSDAAGCLYTAPPPPPPPPPPTPTPTPPRPTPTPTPKPSPTPTPTPTPTPSPTPTPTPTPPPSVRPSPPPTPTPTPTPSPTPTPVADLPLAPPPPPTPTPTPTPRPIRPTPSEITIAPQTAATPPPNDRTVQVLRRWSLATLLVVLTGGAAMAAQRRMHR